MSVKHYYLCATYTDDRVYIIAMYTNIRKAYHAKRWQEYPQAQGSYTVRLASEVAALYDSALVQQGYYVDDEWHKIKMTFGR